MSGRLAVALLLAVLALAAGSGMFKGAEGHNLLTVGTFRGAGADLLDQSDLMTCQGFDQTAIYYAQYDWTSQQGEFGFSVGESYPFCESLTGGSPYGVAIFRDDFLDPQIWAQVKHYGQRVTGGWGTCNASTPCARADIALIQVNNNNNTMTAVTYYRHHMAVHELGHVPGLDDIVQSSCMSPFVTVMIGFSVCLTGFDLHYPQEHDIGDIVNKY